jgi:pimeloyl-ACP methyl ester carboxylesterase
MSFFRLGPQDGLYYAYHPPADDQHCTFVFFNALTSDTSAWETVIGPILRNAGHGTLAYNMRGQTDSPFSPELELSEELIVADAVKLITSVKPARAIFVGLSIGGLFASRAWLKGTDAAGLVLINTLRRDGPRLRWISDALVRSVKVGGLTLFRDLFLPLLMNENWLQENRSNFLVSNPQYAPLDPDSGHFKLLSEAGRKSDWDLPYEQLKLPTLVITGLQDHVFLEKDVIAELFSSLPNGQRFDMPDAGHLIPAEQPEELAELLISFAKEFI